ncbi:MAG: ABC transporter ATP-binding protein [Dehalococcoidia bacterium]
MTPSAISASDLVHSYGTRRALDGLTLEVQRGSVYGLLGPNGSGKSTFITMLAAMETPAQGTLRVFGETPAVALRARVGTVFQENAQDQLLRVADYLRLACRLFGVRNGQARIQALLTQFGLAGRINDPIGSLSGGMRRRLEIVRALLHEPDLVLLDEPTTGVDPGERRALWAALLSNRGDRTILLATNDLSEAEQVCDEVCFLRNGRVVAAGTPAGLKRGLLRESVSIRTDGLTTVQLEQISAWPGSGELAFDGSLIRVTVDDAATFVPRLFALAPGTVKSISVEPTTLEDAYFRIVGERVLAGAVA